MISVTSIVYKPEGTVPNPESQYLRVPVNFANLIEGYGIEGDRKGGHPKRNLNIMSFETLEKLHEEGFKTQPGEMGEQLVIQGLDVDKLKAGDRFQIGEQACIEVVNQRTGCDHFERIQGKTPRQAAGRMGIMAKVTTGGIINVGDTVHLLPETSKAGSG